MTPILYYWGPCETRNITVQFANRHGIELDKRDVEQEQPYEELLALGGDANEIPYLYDGETLIQGTAAIERYLTETYGL